MNAINRKAIFQGTAVFAGLYILHLVIVPILAQFMEGGWKSPALFGLSQLIGVLTCVAGGFVAGRVAQERGFFYGFNVGALGTILSAAAAALWSLVTGAKLPLLWSLPVMILVNGFIGAVSGIVATNFEQIKGGYWKD